MTNKVRERYTHRVRLKHRESLQTERDNRDMHTQRLTLKHIHIQRDTHTQTHIHTEKRTHTH